VEAVSVLVVLSVLVLVSLLVLLPQAARLSAIVNARIRDNAFFISFPPFCILKFECFYNSP
jgi:hypothetical protein